MELDSMILPGNPKGEAVRMEDPDSGPLHRSLELPLVIKALREDNSLVHEHLQQKVAVALSIALGRNPANLTYLKETDFINLTPSSEEPCYVLKMPRIKKRQLNPRDDFMEEYLDPPFSCYLCPKFQPYRHANHEHVLDCLLSSRDTRMKKYENARLGIQLDDVIFAVAQVAEQCKSEASNG